MFAGRPLHPSPIYEAAACALLAVVIVWITHRRTAPGTVLAATLMGYGLIRLLGGFHRFDYSPKWIGVPLSALVALGLVAAGSVMAYISVVFKKRTMLHAVDQ